MNIGQINVLQEMYGHIIVTPEVVEEYGFPLPEWITVQAASDVEKVTLFHKFIDLGEASTIALAMETKNSLLIVDDRRARQFALSLGLEITGTLGLLIQAYENGIIQDIDSIIARLRETGYRLPVNAEALIKATSKGYNSLPFLIKTLFFWQGVCMTSIRQYPAFSTHGC
jgi:predicted nucleic acid-binding protein